MQLKKINHKAFLVVELQPGLATCSIASFKNKELTIVAHESVKEMSPIRAVAQGLERLSQSVKKLPKQVVMLSSEVSCGWMDLNIPSNLTESQAVEMLRWELEGNLEGFGSAPSIENLLFYAPYLEPGQKDKIFENAHLEGFDPLVAARNFGILSEEVSNQFESFIGEFPDANQDYMIAWAETSKLYPSDKTLVAAIPMDYVNEWVSFFAEKNISLLVTYGTTGLSYAAIDSKSITGKSIVLLDSNTQQIQASYIKASKLVDTVVYPLTPNELSEELINDIGMHTSEFIHLGNSQIDLEQLRTAVQAQNPELQLTKFELTQAKSLALTALERLLANSHAYPIPELKTVAPPIPFYKNTQLYWSLSLGLSLCFIASFHVMHHRVVSQLEAEIAEIEIKKESREIKISESSGDQSEARELLQEQARLEEEIARKRIDISPRDEAAFYSASLRAISESIAESVDIKSLKIDRRGNIALQGHSLSEPAVYTFSAQFNKRMVDWDLMPQKTELATDPETGVHAFTILPKTK
jgi:hypothetical protein